MRGWVGVVRARNPALKCSRALRGRLGVGRGGWKSEEGAKEAKGSAGMDEWLW